MFGNNNISNSVIHVYHQPIFVAPSQPYFSAEQPYLFPHYASAHQVHQVVVPQIPTYVLHPPQQMSMMPQDQMEIDRAHEALMASVRLREAAVTAKMKSEENEKSKVQKSKKEDFLKQKKELEAYSQQIETSYRARQRSYTKVIENNNAKEAKLITNQQYLEEMKNKALKQKNKLQLGRAKQGLKFTYQKRMEASAKEDVKHYERRERNIAEKLAEFQILRKTEGADKVIKSAKLTQAKIEGDAEVLKRKEMLKASRKEEQVEKAHAKKEANQSFQRDKEEINLFVQEVGKINNWKIQKAQMALFHQNISAGILHPLPRVDSMAIRQMEAELAEIQQTQALEYTAFKKKEAEEEAARRRQIAEQAAAICNEQNEKVFQKVQACENKKEIAAENEEFPAEDIERIESFANFLNNVE